MTFFRSVALAGWAWRSAWSLATRPSVWYPFWVLAALEAAILTLLASFHRSWGLPLAGPLVHSVGGDAATHYPNFYYYLPVIFARSMVAVSIFVASLTTGVATLLFARGFGWPDREPIRPIIVRRAPHLILVAAFSTAVVYGLFTLLQQVPAHLTHSTLGRWSLRGASLAAVIVVESLLVYTTAWIVLEKSASWAAIRDSVRITSRTLLPTLLLVALPLVLLYPFEYLAGRVDLLASKLTPETIVGVLAARMGVEVLVGFPLVGAVTRLFVWRSEAAS